MASLKAQQPPARADTGQSSLDGANQTLVTDGFLVPDLDPENEAPPAYGELHDQVQFSQPGFEAGAAVTGNLFSLLNHLHLHVPF